MSISFTLVFGPYPRYCDAAKTPIPSLNCLGYLNSMFTLVCGTVVVMLQAPLLLGCDLRNLTKETKAIVTNTEVIAVNQGIK